MTYIFFAGMFGAMATHAQAIDKAGGPRELAKTLEIPLTTVRSWHERSSIPAPYWQWFAERAYITLDELAAASAARKGLAA